MQRHTSRIIGCCVLQHIKLCLVELVNEYVVLALSKSSEVAIEMAQMEPAMSARMFSKLVIPQHHDYLLVCSLRRNAAGQPQLAICRESQVTFVQLKSWVEVICL